MEGLRIILLAVGVLVIAGVYAYSRWGGGTRGRRHAADESSFAGETGGAQAFDDEIPDDLPPLRAVDAESAGMDEPAGDARAQDRGADGAGERQEKIIVLNIMPLDADETFPGGDLLDVFERAGLEYGQYDVFHRVNETSGGAVSVFSVASATEPGSFDITCMADDEFRGLSLFMLLPGPMRGVDAFADMLATARRIAEQVRGEVKDRNRSTLTRQTARHIREEIIAFEHRLSLEN